MPHDSRETIASLIDQGINRYAPAEDLAIRHIQTTSGCPVVEVTLNGEVFNITITKSRKP